MYNSHVPGVAYVVAVVRAKSEAAVRMLQLAAMWNELTYIDGCEMVMVEKHLNMEQVFNEFTGQIQGYGQTGTEHSLVYQRQRAVTGSRRSREAAKSC